MSEWISVRDKLPEERGRYLAMLKTDGNIGFEVHDHFIRILYFGSGGWRLPRHYPEWIHAILKQEVTHWMPYYPPVGRYVFTTRELLTDRRNGDFDTKAVLTLKTPDGKIEEVNRFYAESENGWREISFEEFKAREAADRIRQEMEANNDAE